MKPHLNLAAARTPEGARLTLHSHDGRFSIRCNGQQLMHAGAATSELHLGEVATARIATRLPARILVGGLGLGFTLKSVLAQAGAHARVQVAELVPAVVEWNRTFMAELNGALLDDARVAVLLQDVCAVIARARPASYDAIALDIDNGPTAMVQARNARLYDARGLELILRALKPGGRAAFWSARVDREFGARLAQAGFTVQAVPSLLHAAARHPTYTIYAADKPASVISSPDTSGKTPSRTR